MPSFLLLLSWKNENSMLQWSNRQQTFLSTKEKKNIPYICPQNEKFFHSFLLSISLKMGPVFMGGSYIILICVCDDKKRYGTEIIGTYFYIKRSIHKEPAIVYVLLLFSFLGIRNSWEFIYFYALVVADGKTCRSLKCFSVSVWEGCKIYI